MKKVFLSILILLPFLLNAQEFPSCPLDHYYAETYENPLNEQWLSKYDVKFYHLGLEVSNKNTEISGYTTINIEILEPVDSIVFQLINALDVEAVTVNGAPVTEFQHRDDAIYIPVAVTGGEKLSVTIQYSGDASQDRGFFAGDRPASDE